MGKDDEYQPVFVLLPPELHAELKRIVGSRGMSPTLRRMVEELVEQDRVRQAIRREAGE